MSQARSNDAYAWPGQVPISGRGYTANGLNQYSAVGGTSFAYDADGNLTSDGTNSYVYDVENRLVSTTIGSTSATLRYDPLHAFRLLGAIGKNKGSVRVADFRIQQGIYILYNEYGASYVGLTQKQGLGKRLKDHTADRLQDEWN